MLFGLYYKRCTEFVAVVFATVPNLLLVLLNVGLVVLFLRLPLLLLVLVELGLEGVVLEGVFRRHLLRVDRTVWRVRFNELLDLLLELCLPLVDRDCLANWIVGHLARVGANVLRRRVGG
jgi:hypothetical protein